MTVNGSEILTHGLEKKCETSSVQIISEKYKTDPWTNEEGFDNMDFVRLVDPTNCTAKEHPKLTPPPRGKIIYHKLLPPKPNEREKKLADNLEKEWEYSKRQDRKKLDEKYRGFWTGAVRGDYLIGDLHYRKTDS